MLSTSPSKDCSEDYAIHDFEDFGEHSISEFEPIESISKKAHFIVNYGKLGCAVLSYICGDFDEAYNMLENQYCGDFENTLAFSTELFDELYLDQIPEAVHFYIDYDSFSRDIFISDYLAIYSDGRTHVFNQYS